MSYTNKTLEELNVLDDFLMNAIVTTPEIGEVFCRTCCRLFHKGKSGKSVGFLMQIRKIFGNIKRENAEWDCHRITFRKLQKMNGVKKGESEMKKAMLYISIIMSVVYAVAVGFVIALQGSVRKAQGFIYDYEEAPFMLPVPVLFICIVMIAAVIVFAVLLLRANDNMRVHMETAAVIVLSVLIVLMPWIFHLAMVIQVWYYSYTVGAMGVVAYNMLQRGIAACNPLLVFAMLLQVIYTGISLGKKGH